MRCSTFRKSQGYLVEQVWDRKSDTGTDLDLAKIDTGERVSLKVLKYEEASEILGVWIVPNDDKNLTILIK